MDWYLYIERVTNGFILESNDPNGEGEDYVRVIHWEDDNKLEAYVDLLYEISEHFGMLGSKYDRRRLSIGLMPGEAYEELFDMTRAENEEPTDGD